MNRRLGLFALHSLITVLVVCTVLFIAVRSGGFQIEIGELVIRSQRGSKHPIAALPPSWNAPDAIQRPPDAPPPRGVVIMIGDGMGVGQLSTASALLHGPSGSLEFERFPVIGLMRTVAGNDLVTDSAASATAMATGFKVPRKKISQLEDGRVPMTLFEVALERGYSVGVVTTSGLVDATPAAFLAHAENRTQYRDLLEDMLASGAQLLIGGDWGTYPKAVRDVEYQDALAHIDELAAAAGYLLARSEDELAAADGPVLVLFPPRPGSEGDAHGPPLATTAVAALERLAACEQGFLAMIESEVTDGMGHDNDIQGLMTGMRELEDAVTAVREWAEARGDVLVVVTADHDTGGLGIVGGPYREGRATVRWATDGHTSQWVPLFALGPGAEHFARVVDNTDIGRTVAQLLELTPFPDFGPSQHELD